ncbi:NAD(P)/FAD-dependent oxidoreductase [Methylorubrum rhodesianum]|jgi:NADH dehydrogenase|uniref:NAD(P)/FAD-dependent oxidoreductase n=1 Tax=Methylorubrum rhodesianum TaxID=29427 RepID=A0ABU9ZCS1_9HYPH|nr:MULTISPECIES: NAD(P)/FAD-dependent oxidoreductase [Methylorubrum]MBY0143270.1 NAD(P)/FAD-dependent oxidoreductase [Methylorubrum populi]MRI55613.1 NAD(P)/FAD-dependent oxidoreductase [Methylobacterium sp. DB1607]MBB5761288.1 NADH dehydrogenase [Methylorubrum rhodesianum]MBI1688103.1 NAD(P)/FAD-dependent oxidoreductase [Methylorubrum sp. DB1722]MBK3406236.1 NAD(P)/FAD-dependent oxidoreductase [Methylorubrum rhodesianum]
MVPSETVTDLHKIVVVGGGAAGLELVTKLGNKYGKRGKAHVTLVDRARTHIWKPLLHEVAAGSLDVGHHAVDYLHHAHANHFRYRIGEMTGLDREKRVIHLAASRDSEGREVTPMRAVPYDTLIMAVGSTTNDFGTPGVAEHAIALDTKEQAMRFHQRLVNGMLRAHTQEGPVRPGQLHVTVIGAGATGTELAAELHRTTREVARTGLDRIDPAKDLKITLVEAADRILPAVPQRLAAEVMGQLAKIGVEVRVQARVTEVRADGVQLADGGFIPSELVVWAAGVKGPTFLKDLGGLETTRNNQLVITPTLQTSRDPDVFAIGDCAYLVEEGSQTPIPPRAQAAHQQASHLYGQMANRLAGRPLKPFKYRDFGSLVSLGEYTAVGNLMGFIQGRNMFIAGLFARLMYRSLYKMHETAVNGWWKTSLDALARALTRRTEPRVKLH